MSTCKLLYVASVPLHLYTFWVPYVRHFRAKGWTVDGAAADISRFADLDGVFDNTFDVQFVRNPLEQPFAALGRYASTIRYIRNLVFRGGYDIVHVNSMTATFMTRFALRHHASKPQVIHTAHGFHFFKGNCWWRNALFRGWESVGSRWTDTLITINAEDYAAAQRFRGISADRVVLTPGIGVDLSLYCKRESRTRDELRLTPEQPLLLFVGEMIPRKRHADSIAALAQLARKDIHLAFAGNGEQEMRLRKHAFEAGLGERVHFLGFRKDIPELISAADALLLPSAREGLPRCILEAMSIGTPVIASEIRGNADLLSGGCGLLHAVGDTAALANCVVRLLEDKAAVRQMVTKAQERVRDFSLDKVIAAHERIYESAMNRLRDGSG